MSELMKYVRVYVVCQGICSMAELVKYVRVYVVCQGICSMSGYM